jgi:UDPglucose 6-dehydrogenase
VNIGFIGLGKLGFPCAVAMEKIGGHTLKGYDTNQDVKKILITKSAPFEEVLFEEFLSSSKIELVSNTDELVSWAEIIFIAVQTPHEEMYEGISPVPEKKVDFDYKILIGAVENICDSLEKNKNSNPLIVVISTVLPGTMRQHVLPILKSARRDIRFCYNPYFIAMGNTINDFLNPEFVLVGSLQMEDAIILEDFYRSIHNAPVKKMEIESAELTKVAYNTFIGFKIVFANALAEITKSKGGNVDDVTDALTMATSRLMSGKYLRAGMSDGGGCHPRDQIAMSWLAEQVNLSVDIFGWLASARDLQTQNQAMMIREIAQKTNLPICLLGWAYKANTSLEIGSPAKLLGWFLTDYGLEFTVYDPHVYPNSKMTANKSLFFISTNHDKFNNLKLPAGSHVIDPWGMESNWGDSVSVIRPGRDKSPTKF